MTATIRDVARLAGVAVSTVSLVVNNKGRVSKKTEEKVRQAVAQLDYHPQHSARGLVTRRSGNFGFILSTDHFSQAEPFYTKIFLGTEFEARSVDYYILLTTIERHFNSSKIPRFLLERNVDGVILVGTVPHKIVDYIAERRLPIVLVDYELPRMIHSAVLIDNADGIRQIVHHLHELGHRHMAFIGGDMKHPGMIQRCKAFQETIETTGLPFDPDLLLCDQETSNIETGYVAMEKLLSQGDRFTAVIAANDAMAVGAVRACQSRGYRVPLDFSITGFDDVESAITSRPALTTIHVPKEKMGATALRHLAGIIKGTAYEGTRVTIPVRLVKRDSTDHPRSHTLSA
ncbi:LacI family DNA-binding transcriptional regulator [candidate division KSB1 bacterium]|nr:LacI family DNA-binding transcriptional regulator [candidate division KSB1 bacterium]